MKIFTDSTADLSKEIIEKYDISVIPLYVTIEDQSFIDGVDLTTDVLYELVEKTKTLPKTSAPTFINYITMFKPWLEEGYDILYVGLSSKLSSTLQTAQLVANEYGEGRIFVIDSLNLSTGIGLLVLEAAELAQQGMGAVSISQIITQSAQRIRSSFIIDTLKYLHMGGRCTSLQMIASSILKIRPRIIVKDGGMIVGEKYRGKRKGCLDQFYQDHVRDGTQVDTKRVFVTHSLCQEDAEYFKKRLEDELNIDEIIITEAGTVISSHCGPGTIGILYKEI